MNNKVNCMVCGKEVIYNTYASFKTCYYCGVKEETLMKCENEHYVCNKCHSQDAIMIITHICTNSDLINPLAIADQIMQHPSVHMHGPEHHAMVPAVLIAAFQNYISATNKEDILEAIKRGKQIPGGYCGFYGACAAGIGTGIAVSVITKATPLKGNERSQANFATSKALFSIANAGGSRCCKKSARNAIECGIAYLSDLFKINWYSELDLNIKCEYSKYNKECDEYCKYKNKDIIN